MKFPHFLSVAAVVMVFGLSCASGHNSSFDPNDNDTVPEATVTVKKWYGGKSAVVTIAFDVLWGHWKTDANFKAIVEETLSRNLRIDFEFVTANFNYPEYTFIVDEIREVYLDRGVHFFGHGHEHVFHDSLDYQEAYESFKTCYDYMEEWGLRPRAYAYPHGSGRKTHVQEAVRDAGFICARGVTSDPATCYICPDDTAEPENWYYLPTIPMQQVGTGYVHSHSEFIPYVQQALDTGSWIILMYHTDGKTEPTANSYYSFSDIVADLDLISQNDIWGGNMDSVAQYIRERNALESTVERSYSESDSLVYHISFDDGLDDILYDQPLTVLVSPVGDTTVTGCVVSTADSILTGTEVSAEGVLVNILPDGGEYRFAFTVEAGSSP